MKKQSSFAEGIFFSLGAYVLWGMLPVYWKSIQGVDPFEILADRIIWSLVFVGVLIIILGRWSLFCSELHQILVDKKKLWALVMSSLAILMNWGIFIWSVTNGHIIETSMGYYINPLVSVLIGVLYLKEKLNNYVKLSVVLAAIGVGSMIINVGVFPWISLSLACSFAIYGLIKKLLVVDTLTGILMETLIVSPLACLYIFFLSEQGLAAWQNANSIVLFLLGISGAITAVPLIMFTAGAKLLPLSVIGFLQYIAPTLSLLLGVFVYGERFSQEYLYSFMWIWAGLLVFSYAQIKK